MNLREGDLSDEFEWPESGPSRLPSISTAPSVSLPSEDVPKGRLGPFGAKVAASMTGAVVVSLLSKLNLLSTWTKGT